MTTSNNNWDQSKESINAHYDEIDKQSEKLFQEKKISRDELERKKRSTQLCREYKISHLEYIQRAKDFESGKKTNSKDSKSNKVTEKPVKQLKSVIPADEYSVLPDADKMCYRAKVLPTANEGAAGCIDCINKITPVISAIAPVISVMAPVQNLMGIIDTVKAPLEATASSLNSTLGAAQNFSLGVAGVEVGKPIIQTLLAPIIDMLKLGIQLASLGYAFYTQGPDAYKQIKEGLEAFERNRAAAKKALEDAKKISEEQEKMIKKEADDKKKAEEEAKKDTSKNYISVDDIVISEDSYNKLSSEDKKKYKEETTADKIRLAAKKVEIPKEFKDTINQAKTVINSVSSLYDSLESVSSMATTFTTSVNSIPETLKQVGASLESFIGDLGIPSVDDIIKSVQQDAASIDLIGKSVDIKNKLSSFKSEYVLTNKQWKCDLMFYLKEEVLLEIKEGKLRKILGVPKDKSIEDVFKSGNQIAEILLKKTDYDDAIRMITFAANMNPGNKLFKSAFNAVKRKKPEED